MSELTPRPDIIGEGRALLAPMERLHLGTAQRSYNRGLIATVIRWLQRSVMLPILRSTTKRVHHLHGVERLPTLPTDESFIVVSNHRSFFDFYAVAPELMALGFRQRILFPVRSNFFYANFLGFVINGILSGFAMYPPMFRDRKRSHLNMLGLNDAVWLLRSGGHLLGFHPEGTRNTGDPYTLLPARSGIGHLVRHAQVRVIPVFTNGLPASDPLMQLKYNLLRTGPQIHTVFGAPIDFGSLISEDASSGLYKRIADKARDAIAELALEERELRASYDQAQSSS